jgi:perosamine synthetase
MIPRLKPALGSQEFLAAFHRPRNDDVARFESVFAELTEQRYGVAFPYGRTALIFLLKALGLENKEIICPAYTCVVVPHAIVYSGNVPQFIDCEENGFNMDLEKAEHAITAKTGALIATSLFGYPVNLDRLDRIRKRHPHIHIIQDCAHSFTAQWNGLPVQREGTAAFFGFNISKILTSIFGGMVTTDDEKLSQNLKLLRHQRLKPSDWKKSIRRLTYLIAGYATFWQPLYGLINRFERLEMLNHFVRYYDEDNIDMPRDYLQQMAPVEARVGRINVNRYHAIIQNRRAAAEVYFDHLPDNSNFVLPPRTPGATYSHFAVQVRDRKKWLRNGLKKGLQLGWLIEYNIPEMRVYGERRREDFPIAGKYSRSLINLPVWGGIRIAKKVVDIITAQSKQD